MTEQSLNIVVLGASGDLARKKIFPALFALYCHDLLPEPFRVFGFARTAFSTEQFRDSIAEHLTCRYVPNHSCAQRTTDFLSRCHYAEGSYESRESFLDLYAAMKQAGAAPAEEPVLFYLAIPPFLFRDVARALGDSGLTRCGSDVPWPRVVIEKPFGRDRESSDRLAEDMAGVFTEHQTYRIDHYLGKEVVQNLMVLRFANRVFEPLWNGSHIRAVHIDWKEDIGIGDRGGYFDAYGIIRDVIQSHLLQILALIAMEQPASTAAAHVGNEKVRVLRSVRPVALDDVVLGQYTAGVTNGVKRRAYVEEKAVPPDSLTPTYAAMTLGIDNDRWKGVPFSITAGKALDAKGSEVRMRFRAVPSNIFCDTPECLPANEFVIRIQPDAGLYLNIVNKTPGLRVALTETNLNLTYQSAFPVEIPDAYECLLLDVIRGDRSLFIRADELAASWDIFTPLLHEMEARRVRPLPYEFGTAGPETARISKEERGND